MHNVDDKPSNEIINSLQLERKKDELTKIELYDYCKYTTFCVRCDTIKYTVK